MWGRWTSWRDGGGGGCMEAYLRAVAGVEVVGVGGCRGLSRACGRELILVARITNFLDFSKTVCSAATNTLLSLQHSPKCATAQDPVSSPPPTPPPPLLLPPPVACPLRTAAAADPGPAVAASRAAPRLFSPLSPSLLSRCTRSAPFMTQATSDASRTGGGLCGRWAIVWIGRGSTGRRWRGTPPRR